MARRAPLPWRAALPSIDAWPRLLVAPSSYLLVVGLVATLAAKWIALRRLDELDHLVLHWLAACSSDVLLCGGLIVVLALVEARRAWAVALTVPIALLVAIVALLNAGYLAISGEQLAWSVVALGIERVGDVRSILGATIAVHWLGIVVAILVIAVPFGVRWRLRRSGHPTGHRETATLRARAAGLPAVIALVAVFGAPRPQDPAVAKLRHSAVARTYWGMVSGSGTSRGEAATFAGYTPGDLVSEDSEAALQIGAHPNIVVVILESTRRDFTSLAGASGRARTPTLVELAGRGLEMTHARAVMPLTSKSIWSMLCGRLPLMQHALYENTDALDVECLPAVLQRTGWRTLFAQSADGQFEDRPRLVDQLGFAEFLARTDVGAELLGYVASDEASLTAPIAAWIDRAPARPFFLTVLTSATHHPYVMSDAHRERARDAGLAVTTDADRYARQLESADRMIATLLDALRERGLIDNTIIAVIGDHGEGFGDKGTMQHGANFYEEGLRVPWVMAGPGVPHRTITANTVVLDLAPTLLDLVGVAPRADVDTPARSVIDEPLPDRTLPFACLYDAKCRGFVRGTTKVVYIHEAAQSFHYDLAADPQERAPLPLTAALVRELDAVQTLLARYRTSTWLRRRGAMHRYPAWTCAADRPCLPIER